MTGKIKDWFVIYNEDKDEFFAIEDKHGGVTPKMIGNMEVVGVCAFKKPIDAIDHIKFIQGRNY